MSAEIWDLYNAEGQKTDRVMKRGEEIPSGMYHLVVHVWPINSQGEFLIQKRADTVLWKPGTWATTGGSAVSGEDALKAAHRELLEELGYNAYGYELIRIACLRRSNSFCNVFVLKTDLPAEQFVLQKEEVAAVKWCNTEQLMRMVSSNMLYNYGDAYFKMLLHYQKTHP